MSHMLYLSAVLGILICVALKGVSASGQPNGVIGDVPQVTRNNPWGLPDCDRANQAGGFAETYDEAYEKASGQTGVPFALIKAHAIRESSQMPEAYHYDNPKSGASYGLLQVEWKSGSNRFSKYGVDDAEIGNDGSGLYDPEISAYLGACIMRDNLNWLKGNVRDAINAYNTGVPETKREAPANYVDDVINYYSKIIGQGVV
jgi:soluble lytic murein transglycosylase-like protein